MQLVTAMPSSCPMPPAPTRTYRSSIACPDGDPAHCKGFMLQSSLFLNSLGQLSDEEKVAEFICLLSTALGDGSLGGLG